MISLVIDAREPDWIKESIGTLTQNESNINLVQQYPLLEKGDFLLEGTKKIAIERKSVQTDFLTSLTNGHLQDQMFRITHDGLDVVMLAIEGCPRANADGFFMRGKQVTGWKWSSIAGILTTIQGLGVYVHWVPEGHFPSFIVSQCKYWDKEVHGSIKPSYGFPMGASRGTLDYQKRVLMALPGIGDELCERILSKYTLGEILKHPEMLYEVDGLGSKKVKAIEEILNA